MKSEVLSDREIRVLTEQIQLPDIGIAGQEKIKKASVLVIGAGGKGTAALQSLASAGIGMIGITDNMLVEEKTLPRQSLYGEKDLGKQRAIISANRLTERGCSSQINLHNICLLETNILEIIAPYDLLIDATDNFPAHHMINDAAVIAGKPWVYGSVHNGNALVTTFNYSGGPSFRCLYPQLTKSREPSGNDGIPAISILYGIAGSLMAAEALKIILHKPTQLNGKLLHFQFKTLNTRFTDIKRNDDNFKINSFQ
jgi:sulfur-carrier protein adenylyltransferase/sulfurtransferase